MDYERILSFLDLGERMRARSTCRLFKEIIERDDDAGNLAKSVSAVNGRVYHRRNYIDNGALLNAQSYIFTHPCRNVVYEAIKLGSLIPEKAPKYIFENLYNMVIGMRVVEETAFVRLAPEYLIRRLRGCGALPHGLYA